MQDPASVQSDFDDFLKTRTRIAQAYVNGDGGPLAAITAMQDPATFFGPSGDVVQGAATVLDVNLQGAAHFREGSTSSLEILHARASGELAYWVGLQRANVCQVDGGGSQLMTLRITEVFRRESGRWVLIHRHADMKDDVKHVR